MNDRIATEDYVDAIDAADVGAVPTTRQVNGHALSADVTVTKGDVGLGNADNTADSAKAFAGSQITSGTVADARIASTIARDSEVAAGYQPLDADLTALGGLDSSTAGAVASDGAGWIKKTYAQFKTALGLAKGDVGLGNVDNTSDATKDAAATTLTNKTLTAPTIGASIISALNWQPSGRLTLTTAVPVTTADVAAATTVYYTPYRGNLIPLWNGATWTTIPFAEKSLSLSGLTADSNYDIFGYLSSGDLALEALIWSTGTARATALALTNGFYTKSGDQTRLYLGTIRITAAGGACDDTLLKRYVWNNYNRIYRAMQATDSTSHNYQSATIRQWNANTANRVDFVTGLLEEGMTLGWVADVTSTDGTSTTVRASLDSLTSGGSAIVAGAVLTQGTARLRAGNAGVVKLETIATPGYHYLAVTEQSGAANNALFTSVGLYVGTNM